MDDIWQAWADIAFYESAIMVKDPYLRACSYQATFSPHKSIVKSSDLVVAHQANLSINMVQVKMIGMIPDGQSFQIAFLSWLTKNPSPSTKDAFSRNDLFIDNCVRFPDDARRIVILKALGSATLLLDSRRTREGACVCVSESGACDSVDGMSVCCDVWVVNGGVDGSVTGEGGGAESVAMTGGYVWFYRQSITTECCAKTRL
jgi:hypothetical protein